MKRYLIQMESAQKYKDIRYDEAIEIDFGGINPTKLPWQQEALRHLHHLNVVYRVVEEDPNMAIYGEPYMIIESNESEFEDE